MGNTSVWLSKDAAGIFPFDGYRLAQKSHEDALFRAMNNLKPGEILRLFVGKNPLEVIRKLAMEFGAKFVFEYLSNRDGLVIIDFKRVGL